jgi:transposase InsO family protein
MGKQYYIYTNKRKCILFLSLVTNIYSREIIGSCVGSMLESITFKAAHKRIKDHLPADLIHYSNRSCQYTGSMYTSLFRSSGVRISMPEHSDPNRRSAEPKKMLSNM